MVDDDPHVLNLLQRTFSAAGARVITAGGGHEGLRLLYDHQPDLVILDVMMPDLDGWQVCSRIRQLSTVPIIFVTALGADEDIVKGLDSGAIDFVTKPFSPEVLLARARAALRQASLTSNLNKSMTYCDGHLAVDLGARWVRVRDTPVKLTGTEYRLLAHMLQNAGQVLTFQQILETIWGWEYRDHVEYVHVFICQLRRKLEADPQNPQYLLSEPGVGYRFQKQPLIKAA